MLGLVEIVRTRQSTRAGSRPMVRSLAWLVLATALAGCGRNITTGASTNNATLPDEPSIGSYHLMSGSGEFKNLPFKIRVIARQFESDGKLAACGVAYVDGGP